MNPIIRRGITHQFKVSDISIKGTYSSGFETDKLKWKIHLGIDTTNGKKQTFIRLIYSSENSQDPRWICDVSAKIAISKQSANPENKMVQNLVTCFYGGDGLSRNVYFPKLTKILGFFEKDHTIYINIEMDFKYFDFSTEIPDFTDLKILAKDTEFHVNKGVICAKSEFFYELFVEQKFVDKIYPFCDVSLPSVCYFLAFCYSSLDGLINDVMETIHLASFYRVSSLRIKCEKYYIDSKTKCKLERKLWIAETFGLEQVMTHALKSVKSHHELKDLQKTPEFAKFTDSTKCRILTRLLELV